jgi:hypothetical protein
MFASPISIGRYTAQLNVYFEKKKLIDSLIYNYELIYDKTKKYNYELIYDKTKK